MILDHQIPVVPIHWKSEDWDSAALGPDLSARTARRRAGRRGTSGTFRRTRPFGVRATGLGAGVGGRSDPWSWLVRRPDKATPKNELEEGGLSGRETIQKKAAQQLKELSRRPHKGA